MADHQLISDECLLDEHEECTGVPCDECEPPPRPCVCACGHPVKEEG